MIPPSICFIRQYGKKLELRLNSFENGHDRIYWHKSGSTDKVNAVVAMDPEMTIAGFEEEGWYEFYSGDGVEVSSPQRVYLRCESQDTELSRMIKLTGDELSEEDLEPVIKKIRTEYRKAPEAPLLFVMKRVLDSECLTKSDETFMLRLMRVWEQYSNMVCRLMNRDLDTEALLENGSVPEISTGSGRSVCIIEIKRDNDEFRPWKVFRGRFPADDGRWKIFFREKEIIRIIVADEVTGNWQGVFYHYQPNEEETRLSWHSRRKKSGAVAKLKEELHFYDFPGTEFSDREQEWFVLEAQLINRKRILPRPSVRMNSHGKIVVSYQEKSLVDAFCRAGNNGLRQCFVARDLFEDAGWENRIFVTGETVTLDPDEFCLYGETLFFIRDASGNFMSGISFLDVGGTDTEPYSEKVKALEKSKISKELLRMTAGGFPDKYSCVEGLLEEMKSNPEVMPERIHFQLLGRLNSICPQKEVIRLMNKILENYRSQFDFRDSFFRDDSPVFFCNENRVAFPGRQKGYIVCQGFIPIGEKEVELDYSCRKESCDYYVNRSGIHFFFGIDTGGFVSGFLVVDARETAREKIFTIGVNCMVK